MSIEPQAESGHTAESRVDYPLKQPAGEQVETLASRIKGAREAAKLSQQEVASHLGVSRQSVAQWELGANRPSHKHIARLATYLSVTEAWMLLGDGNPKTGVAESSHDEDDKEERRRELIRDIRRLVLELDDLER